MRDKEDNEEKFSQISIDTTVFPSVEVIRRENI